jgi:hypothetical protein
MDSNIIAQGTEKVINLVNNPKALVIGVILIGVTFLIIFFLKQFIVNSIIGVIGLFICAIIGIKLPFVLTLIFSVIFGLAGIGIMLILRFFGIL